jgi:hypothetical protein
MQVELTSAQQTEMQERDHDVDALLAALHARGRPEATRESAFLAWSDWSDTSAASWLIVMPSGDQSAYGRDEIVAAHDCMLIAEVDKRVRHARSRNYDHEIHEFVRDYLAQTSTDLEDTDILTVSGVTARGEDDIVLGHMRSMSQNDFGLVGALTDRFDVELPAGFDGRFNRAMILLPFGIAVEDAKGFSA